VGFWRYVSLASVSAAAAMPLLVYFFGRHTFAPPISVTVGSLAAAMLIVYKHDANLQRLVEGTEPKFSLSKKEKRSGMSRIAILGGGSWGTSLAILFSRNREGHQIALWVHDAELARAMRDKRENATYLPGQTLGLAVSVHSEIAAAIDGAEIVVGAMPSAHARQVYRAAATALPGNVTIVSATKGLEPASQARMSEVIAQVIPPQAAKIAVLSGPSFALERREASRPR